MTSRVGAVAVDVQATDDVMRGWCPCPTARAPADGVRLARASKVPGVWINDLTEPDLLDFSGNAALSGVPVTVAPA